MSCCKQVIPDMVERGSGNIIILGATGSLRGGANFAAFASAKNGQRALAESMARHLGPKVRKGSISWHVFSHSQPSIFRAFTSPS